MGIQTDIECNFSILAKKHFLSRKNLKCISDSNLVEFTSNLCVYEPKTLYFFLIYHKSGFPKLCSAERFRSAARFFLFRRKLKKLKNTLPQTKNIITVGDPNFSTIPYRSVPYRTLPFTVRIFIPLAVS